MQIIPEWEKHKNPSRDKKTIILSPGMAFGTGTHPTTHSLPDFFGRIDFKAGQERLLHVGTGSGMLSIAAAKLGLKQITAVEVDPVALDIAKKNAQKNRVIPKIRFQEAIPTQKSFQYIIANVTAQVLISGGFFILSGIFKRGRSGDHRPI